MSISFTVVRSAAVCWASTSRWAIRRRIMLIGTTSSLRAGVAVGFTSVLAVLCSDGSGCGSRPGLRPSCSTYRSTSSFSRRPPGPVAVTCPASNPYSASKRSAAGMTIGGRSVKAVAGGKASAEAAAASRDSPSCRSVIGFCDSSRYAITSPTLANWSSCFTIFVRAPATGAGIWSVALSVSISTSSSSLSTQSPFCFSHRTICTS